MGVTSSLWVEGKAGLQATQGSDPAARSGLGHAAVADFSYGRVDAFCSEVDDDLRVGERRRPLLGLLAIVAFWVVVLVVGDAVITTFS